MAPSIESLSTGPSPLNQVLDIDVTNPGGGDDGGATDQEFEVLVRDPNVEDTVHCRAFLDLRPGLPDVGIGEGDVERDTAKLTQGRFHFSLPPSLLAAGACHKVELICTSHGFHGLPDAHVPNDVDDVGTATWWIAATSMTQLTVDMDTCP